MKKFKNIYIEITNVCNLNCSFCPKTNRKARAMTAVEFACILDKVAHRTEYIYLHVVGEPLLNPELDKILSFCDEKNAKLKITTNGTLLKDNIEILIAHPSVRTVNISLSCTKDFDEKKSQDYLDDVILAAKILSQNKITITLRTWTDTKHSDITVKKIKKAFNADVFPARNGIQKINERILFDIEKEFTWPVSSTAAPLIQNPCLALRKQLAILSDGTVVPCCLDNDGTLNLGNIFKQTVEEILSSERGVKIAKGFQGLKAVEPFCQTCTFSRVRLKQGGV